AVSLEGIFDPTQTTYRDILAFFFQVHGPSTLDQQGNDRGTSHRSASRAPGGCCRSETPPPPDSRRRMLQSDPARRRAYLKCRTTNEDAMPKRVIAAALACAVTLVLAGCSSVPSPSDEFGDEQFTDNTSASSPDTQDSSERSEERRVGNEGRRCREQ